MRWVGHYCGHALFPNERSAWRRTPPHSCAWLSFAWGFVSSILLVVLNVTRTNSTFEWPSFTGAGHDLSGPRRAVASALESVDADGIRALYEAGGLRAPDGDISGSDADRVLDRFSDPVEHFRTPEEFLGRVRDAGLGAMVPVDTMIRVLDPGQVTVDRGANRLFDAPLAPEMTDHQRLFKVFCRFLSIEHRDIDIERELEEIGYLKATLEAIANGHPKSSIDDLLPWNFQPSN